jgi:hypothetical protein
LSSLATTASTTLDRQAQPIEISYRIRELPRPREAKARAATTHFDALYSLKALTRS